MLKLQNTKRRGFTIVEMMVVMSIMALMAVLGIAALTNINNDAITEKAVEEILSEIRELRNKSFSVAESSAGSGVFPVSWGMKISSSGTVPDSFTPFYITEDAANANTFQITYLDSLDSLNSAGFLLPNIKPASQPSLNDLYLIYSAPFGKFSMVRSLDDRCSICAKNNLRPYDLDVSASEKISESIDINIKFRSNARVLTVGSNGDVYISQ